MPGCIGTGVAERSYPTSKVGAVAKRSYPTSKVREVVKTSCCTPEVRAKRSYHRPEVRGGSREELPHIQGVVAMQAQEGRKELLHVQGQEGRP